MKNLKLPMCEILNRIGYFLKKKNMSAYSLSLTLGKSQNYVYRIQSGKTKLYMEVLLDMLEILDVSMFEFTYPDLQNYETDIKIFELIKNLNEKDLKNLKR